MLIKNMNLNAYQKWHFTYDNTCSFWQWRYLPLVGNKPSDSVVYYIAVETAVTSSKEIISSVYMNITGKDGSSGTRKLEDGERKVPSEEQSHCSPLKKIANPCIFLKNINSKDVFPAFLYGLASSFVRVLVVHYH